jgi:hypothetical protein
VPRIELAVLSVHISQAFLSEPVTQRKQLTVFVAKWYNPSFTEEIRILENLPLLL